MLFGAERVKDFQVQKKCTTKRVDGWGGGANSSLSPGTMVWIFAQIEISSLRYRVWDITFEIINFEISEYETYFLTYLWISTRAACIIIYTCSFIFQRAYTNFQEKYFVHLNKDEFGKLSIYYYYYCVDHHQCPILKEEFPQQTHTQHWRKWPL